MGRKISLNAPCSRRKYRNRGSAVPPPGPRGVPACLHTPGGALPGPAGCSPVPVCRTDRTAPGNPSCPDPRGRIRRFSIRAGPRSRGSQSMAREQTGSPSTQTSRRRPYSCICMPASPGGASKAEPAGAARPGGDVEQQGGRVAEPPQERDVRIAGRGVPGGGEGGPGPHPGTARVQDAQHHLVAAGLQPHRPGAGRLPDTRQHRLAVHPGGSGEIGRRAGVQLPVAGYVGIDNGGEPAHGIGLTGNRPAMEKLVRNPRVS